MNPRKLVERQRLDALLACLGLARLADPEDSERPDFLLRMGERTIGVEVTHLVSPRVPEGINPRQADKVLRRVIAATREDYLARGGVPVHASIRFRRGLRLTKRAGDELAHRLAPLFVSEIQRAYTRQPHRQPLEVVIHDPDVDHLGAWPCRAGETPEWHALSGGIVQHAADVDILTTLRPKDAKVAAYWTCPKFVDTVLSRYRLPDECVFVSHRAQVTQC